MQPAQSIMSGFQKSDGTNRCGFGRIVEVGDYRHDHSERTADSEQVADFPGHRKCSELTLVKPAGRAGGER